MKRITTIIAAILMLSLTIVSCKKEDEINDNVTLGAQSNTTTPGYLAVEENKTYNMAEAKTNQETIDIFCFYEAETGNNIALASPGTGITGIFTGDNAPETWTTKNTTNFIVTSLTEVQFSALQQGDQIIETSFDAVNARRKAKDLQAGQVWSFKTADLVYGLILVTEVKQGADGSVVFKMKTRKVIE